MSEPSPTRKVAAKVIFAAFQALQENGGEMRSRDVIAQVEKRVELDEWALERYETSGNIRWVTFLRWFTVDCVKAGYLLKKGGTWYLTPEGEEAMALGPKGLLDEATKRYRIWDAERKQSETQASDDLEEKEEVDAMPMDQIHELANASLEQHIGAKNPYEFQDLVAALLRGMGYYTPFVAPR